MHHNGAFRSIYSKAFIEKNQCCPLTRRDMDWEYLTETVIRMDADAEPPWMGSRRVSIRCYRFMSRVHRNTPYPAISPVAC